MKWLLCLALVGVAGVANGQSSVTFSGFDGPGASWTTNLERLNGQWSLSGGVCLKPVRLIEYPSGQPQNPNETMVAVTRRQNNEVLVTVSFRTPDIKVNGVPTPHYATVFVKGRTGLGSIPFNAFPGDPRIIIVQ